AQRGQNLDETTRAAGVEGGQGRRRVAAAGARSRRQPEERRGGAVDNARRAGRPEDAALTPAGAGVALRRKRYHLYDRYYVCARSPVSRPDQRRSFACGFIRR